MLKFLKKGTKQVDIKISETAPLIFFDAVVNDKHVMRMQCVRETAESLLIGDIFGCQKGHKKNTNKGYGSKLMEAMLSYAAENGIRNITGNLSVVDLDHKERLHHFYEKFGFSITEYDSPKENYYGTIQKEIEV